MERYSEYKDSGVQWLGEIPGHWNCVRIKALFLNIREKNNPIQTEERLSLSIDKGVTLYSEKTTNLDRFKEDCSQYLLAHEDDIVLNSMNMIVGAVGKSKYFGCVSPAYYVIRLRDTSNYIDYYSQLLNIQKIRDVYRIMGKGIMAIDRGDGKVNTCRLKVPYDSFGSIKIPLPPLSEQHSIVSYLDDKCGKIDKMLEGKQKQIELLTEMKQRIIADAVTHGLNPDVKMKATNIPWLPEIPEHWSCIKLKAFCKDNKEKNKGNIESCVLSLSYGNVIVKQNVNFGLVPDNYESYQIVKPGYIILRLTDLQNDHKSLRTGLVKNRGIITSAYVGLVVSNINCEYVHLLLHSYDVMKVFYGMGGGLRQSMSYQDISNLYIPVPPLSEQRTIVSYITDKTAKIDTLTSKLQQEIESIKEYKQRLISDVVTGQIKIC
jgi:type I restriction enzyme S subunit